MCGITGIYNLDIDKKVDKSKLKSMTDSIKHRGPDGEGFHVFKNIGLGHRRLSIIDITGGDQPMFNEDKSICIVFNGEIYNYIELKSKLSKKGYLFKTNSDTEVIIKAYQEWGVNCQSKFIGMWAFAIWDSNKKNLFISRDRLGEKPLIYSFYKNTFVFSSEIKSIFKYGIPPKIRPELIELYLTLTNIPAPNTFYKNIYKLMPGHYIIVNSNGFNEYKYWDLPEIDEDNMINNKNHIYDEFQNLFLDSVKIQMRSDVPFGAFLSGGLDSSSIVSEMTKISSHPVETFTIGFPQKKFDESKLASLVSQKFKTNHNLGVVNPQKIDESINLCVNHFDEPFGDSSAIPTFQVSKFASDKVKMVLTGDGGDEVLSGYNSYLGLKLSGYYMSLPFFFRKNTSIFLSLMSKFSFGNSRYKLNNVLNFINTSELNFNQKIIEKYAFTSLTNIKNLTSSIKNKYSVNDYIDSKLNDCNYNDDFYKLMYLNFKHNLPDDYLVKVDRMSMSNSIETRAPFLDYRLIEFMVKVCKNIKLQGFERKSILRKTIGKNLPKQLLYASKKGFATPLRDWFKDENYNTSLNFKNLNNIFDKKILKKIIDENNSGKKDNGNFLWTLIMLDNFIK